MLEKYSQLANNEVGPSKMTACVKLWQTDGVSTRLFFAPNGSAMAASGAHNSVQVPLLILNFNDHLSDFSNLQVMSSHVLLKLENKDDFTRCDTVEKVQCVYSLVNVIDVNDIIRGQG